MTSPSRTIRDYGQIHTLTPDTHQQGPVPLDEAVTVRTLDSSGGQINVTVPYDELDRGKFFPVTGPIAIEEVRAGDAVGIEILEIRPDETAHTWTRPGLGLLPDRRYSVLQLDTSTLEIRSSDSTSQLIATATKHPHVGALGLLPDSTQAPRTLGSWGGNVDFNAIEAGSTLWLQANVDGGGFFIGDIHAAIGDGEVCGTGAETGAVVTVRFHRSKTWKPTLPTVIDTNGHTWLIGVGDTVEEALRQATQECVTLLARVKGLSMEDAYLAAGLLLRVRLCQIVNPRTSVAVTLSGGADQVLREVHP